MLGNAWDGKDIDEMAAKPHSLDGHMRLTGSPDSPNRKLIHRSGSAYNNRAGAAGAYDFSLKGNYAFQEWTQRWAEEALRVLKPGGHLLSFSSTRTYHRMVCGIEDAGFEIRDSILYYGYGVGFPKATNVSKAIDKALGKEEVASDAAREWEGWTSALKPSYEPILMARKPFVGPLYENVTRYGTGAINTGACRINRKADDRFEYGRDEALPPIASVALGDFSEIAPYYPDEGGRWPANTILSHSSSCQLIETREVPGRTIRRPVEKMLPFGGGAGKEYDTINFPPDEVEIWDCVEDCPVRVVDEQSGVSRSTGGANGGKLGERIYGSFANKTLGANAGGLGDTGGASRYFYTAKVSQSERHAGCEGVIEGANTHPT